MKEYLPRNFDRLVIWSVVFVVGFLIFSSNVSAQLINEIVVNPNSGDDNCEYVEIIGTPDAALTNIYFASVEGDSSSNEGGFNFVVDLGAESLGSNGLIVVTAGNTTGVCGTRTYNSPPTTLVRDAGLNGGGFQNGTNSWLLIMSPTMPIVEGTDYDTDDNGTLEGLPGDAVIMDSLGWSDGGGADIVYGSVDLPATAGGTPDMATRFPGNMDANSAGAWYYGDMDGETDSLNYDLTQVSTNFPTGGILTPGEENAPAATALQKPNADFDGDGITDFSIVRDESTFFRDRNSEFFRATSVREKLRIARRLNAQRKATPEGVNAGTSLVWYISESMTGNAEITGFGDAATDFIVPEDYDGDGQDDLAVWRGTSATTATFFIFESSTSTVREEMFGQINDDPTVAGDYDGDGKADVAVYRCPANPGQCFFFFRGSENNPNGDITFTPWGFGDQLGTVANPGDYDGDGKYDFCIQREDPENAGQGQFVLLNSGDSSINYVNWGLANDFIIPGDYDGDGRSDFMIRRSGSNPYEWYLLESDGGTSVTLWGTTGDIESPGDYDADGKQDIAIWRPDAASPNFFYVLRSSDQMLQTFGWGSESDVPVASWYVH